MKNYFAIFALIATLCLSVPGLCVENAGVTLPDEENVGGETLVINGTALREKFFVDVYVAALYLVEKADDPTAILSKDAPRLMVMQFVHDVDNEKISEAWIEGLEENVANVSPELREQFNQLGTMMEDIKDGEAMAFAYTPTQGTTVTVKGAVKGVIEGKPFADAILSTWIGPKPGPGDSFKEDILGK